MTLTQKENDLLKDLRSQERLCIEKYGKYEQSACDGTLRQLFGSIRMTEEKHLGTVNDILNGKDPSPATPPSSTSKPSAEASAPVTVVKVV